VEDQKKLDLKMAAARMNSDERATEIMDIFALLLEWQGCCAAAHIF
jgi:hypothetical protein